MIDPTSPEDDLKAIYYEVMRNLPPPGVFPALSLGPGQRFASKGSYVVFLDRLADGAAEWIVP